MRLIDADALLNNVLDISPYCGHCDGYGFVQLEMIIDAVKEAPTIEAEPVKHGRWVDHCVRDWRCSECGEKLMKVRRIDGYCYDDKPNYCPNCGCKMDLEKK